MSQPPSPSCSPVLTRREESMEDKSNDKQDDDERKILLIIGPSQPRLDWVDVETGLHQSSIVFQCLFWAGFFMASLFSWII